MLEKMDLLLEHFHQCLLCKRPVHHMWLTTCITAHHHLLSLNQKCKWDLLYCCKGFRLLFGVGVHLQRGPPQYSYHNPSAFNKRGQIIQSVSTSSVFTSHPWCCRTCRGNCEKSDLLPQVFAVYHLSPFTFFRYQKYPPSSLFCLSVRVLNAPLRCLIYLL